MENLKYDSLYKFMVSLGVIIILATILVNNYIFYNNEIILITNEEISQLTDISSKIITQKQKLLYDMVNNYKNIFCASLAIAGFGIGLLLLGSIFWYINVQKIEDEKRKLENNKLVKEIDKMSYEEKQNKVSIEVKEVDKKITINEYLKVENEIVDVIRGVFRGNKILRDVKVGNDESIDCLIPYDNPKNLLTKAFEIKYVKNVNMTFRYLNRIEESMQKVSERYYEDYSQFCYVVTLLIVDNFEEFIIQNKKIIDKIREYNTISNNDSHICKIYIADQKSVRKKLMNIKNDIEMEF